MQIQLEGGKYTINLEECPHKFEALRYGSPWRDLTGDKLVLSLVHRILDLEEELKQAAS